MVTFVAFLNEHISMQYSQLVIRESTPQVESINILRDQKLNKT